MDTIEKRPIPFTWMLVFILVVLFDIFICTGTAYLVFWCNQSGWWWLLSIILMGGQWAGAKRFLGIPVEEDEG